MATINTDDLISVTEAGNRGMSALVREAEEGRKLVFLRNNRPVAAMVSITRLEEIQHLEEDILDISLTAARMLTDSGQRTTLADVLDRFGVTREELLAEHEEEPVAAQAE